MTTLHPNFGLRNCILFLKACMLSFYGLMCWKKREFSEATTDLGLVTTTQPHVEFFLCTIEALFCISFYHYHCNFRAVGTGETPGLQPSCEDRQPRQSQLSRSAWTTREPVKPTFRRFCDHSTECWWRRRRGRRRGRRYGSVVFPRWLISFKFKGRYVGYCEKNKD